MLYRRIKDHVLKENWFAVVIDFVILVVGVFMGIQVQAYYQEKSDQRLLEGYLDRLHDDVALSLSRTQRTREFVQQNLDNLNIVFGSIRDCKVETSQQDRVANGLYHIGKMIPETFVDGTLTELRASGRLLLLENEELRVAINEMVREHEYLARVWPAIQRRAHESRNLIDSKIIYLIDRPTNGFSQISWSELDIDLDEFCGDREILARLSDLRRMANVNVDWLGRMLARFEVVLMKLEGEATAAPGST